MSQDTYLPPEKIKEYQDSLARIAENKSNGFVLMAEVDKADSKKSGLIPCEGFVLSHGMNRPDILTNVLDSLAKNPKEKKMLLEAVLAFESPELQEAFGVRTDSDFNKVIRIVAMGAGSLALLSNVFGWMSEAHSLFYLVCALFLYLMSLTRA